MRWVLPSLCCRWASRINNLVKFIWLRVYSGPFLFPETLAYSNLLKWYRDPKPVSLFIDEAAAYGCAVCSTPSGRVCAQQTPGSQGPDATWSRNFIESWALLFLEIVCWRSAALGHYPRCHSYCCCYVPAAVVILCLAFLQLQLAAWTGMWTLPVSTCFHMHFHIQVL